MYSYSRGGTRFSKCFTKGFRTSTKKITIVPRTMGALGYVMHVPEEEEKFLNAKKELEAMFQLVIWADVQQKELVFDTVTTGAANDIEQASQGS